MENHLLELYVVTFLPLNNHSVQQARIALERRKFLKNASIAVQRQTTWSNLAHEMTAEFRGLCAEEVDGNFLQSLWMICRNFLFRPD